MRKIYTDLGSADNTNAIVNEDQKFSKTMKWGGGRKQTQKSPKKKKIRKECN